MRKYKYKTIMIIEDLLFIDHELMIKFCAEIMNIIPTVKIIYTLKSKHINGFLKKLLLVKIKMLSTQNYFLKEK